MSRTHGRTRWDIVRRVKPGFEDQFADTSAHDTPNDDSNNYQHNDDDDHSSGSSDEENRPGAYAIRHPNAMRSYGGSNDNLWDPIEQDYGETDMEQSSIPELQESNPTTTEADMKDSNQDRSQNPPTHVCVLLIVAVIIACLLAAALSLGPLSDRISDERDDEENPKCDNHRIQNVFDPFLQCDCKGEIFSIPDEVKQISNNFSGVLGLSGNFTMEKCEPSSLALVSLASSTQRPVQPGRLRTLYALAYFYAHFQGRSWAVQTGWLSTAHECEWFGVECNDERIVDGITLPSNILEGKWEDDMVRLLAQANLRNLNLGGNNVWGTLDSITQMSQLEVLVLSKNSFHGAIPSSIGSLSRLSVLDLSENFFSGSIPDSVGSLTNLTNLGLERNSLLSGTLPPSLGGLASLQLLSLFECPIRGTIPTTLGRLSSLVNLELGSMKLSGSIPTELGLLTQLKLFNTQFNLITGSIPTSFGGMTRLTYLLVHAMDLSGAIPTELYSLTNLKGMRLDQNQLSGTLSTEVLQLKKLEYLSMSFNPKITGSLPEAIASELPLLLELNVIETSMSGTIPVDLSSREGMQLSWSCTMTCSNCRIDCDTNWNLPRP